MSKTPRELAVEKAEAAFAVSNGYSHLWDEIVKAWELAFRAEDALRKAQWPTSDFGDCPCCHCSEAHDHRVGCEIAELLKEFE